MSENNNLVNEEVVENTVKSVTKTKMSGMDILRNKRNNQTVGDNKFQSTTVNKFGATANVGAIKSSRKAQRKG